MFDPGERRDLKPLRGDLLEPMADIRYVLEETRDLEPSLYFRLEDALERLEKI